MSAYSIKNDYEKTSSQLEIKPWGTFPFHSGNFWHSGIHIRTDGKKITPILNGKVAAYRIRDKEKEVELSELLTEVEYKALGGDISSCYDSEYKLKDKQNAPKKKVSDSFILLKHEIKRYNPPLVFYTLYMNLGAVSSEEQKYYPSIKDNLNKFVCCNPELDSIGYIPNGFKGNGEEYIDFVLFTESNDVISAHKVNEQLKIYKPIPVTEQLYTGKLKENIKPKRNGIYLIPNESDYVKKNYSTSGKETAVEIELKSYNAMVKIVENDGKRTLWWVSASDYSEDGFRRDFSRPDGKKKAEGVEYVIDLLKNSSFVKKCEAKDSSYKTTAKENQKPARTNIVFSDAGVKTNPKFWTKETSHFNDEIGTEGKTSCYDGTHAYSILKEVYDENPFQFTFTEINNSSFSFEEVEVKDSTLYYGEINGQKTECCKVRHGDTEYFIKKDTADKYLEDAFDFSEWFIDLTAKSGKSKGIICDKKNVYESLHLETEIKSVLIGDYKKEDFDILLGSDRYSPELRKIRKTLRTVICRHPLEWDETLFNSDSFSEDYRNINRNRYLISKVQTKNLQKTARDTDIWKDGLKKLFTKNEFNFFHPLYFLNYLDRIGMLEFNPYEGKTIEIKSSFEIKEINGEKIKYGSPGMTFNVKDNPGFAPVTESTENVYPYAGKNYTKVTGGFKEDYSKVICNKTKKLRYCDKKDSDGNDNPSYDPNKKHVGVDFRGQEGESVVSLINCKVLGYGVFGNYGKTVIVGHSSGTGVYLAAHLSKYNEKLLKNGYVTPGEIIGFVGGTGAGGEVKFVPHLHVTYYNINWKNPKYQTNTNPITNSILSSDLVKETSDPFYHTRRF